MRIGFPGGPRLDWYDRNPQNKAISYGASGVAPHSITTRDQYTVPTGKKCIISGAYADILRRAAAGTLGEAYIFFTVAGADLVAVSHSNNTVGHSERGQGLNASIALAGVVLMIQTVDTSTGGTINYYAAMAITEIDA